MKLIFGGHWTAAPEGWTALRQADQDITKRLNYDDGTVDAIFTEHVIEHVDFIGGVYFMREAHRVLKPGGIFRCVAPMTEAIQRFAAHDEMAKRYAHDTLSQFYVQEQITLKRLGLDLDTDPTPFLIDGLVRKHWHQFVWSELLMCAVLQKIGFTSIFPTEAGVSELDPSTCLERPVRGVHEENMRRDLGARAPETWDCESGFVEARK